MKSRKEIQKMKEKENLSDSGKTEHEDRQWKDGQRWE